MTSRRLLNPEAKILLDAADYIEKHGHCKNSLYDEKGRVCIRGAIYAASSRGSISDLSFWGTVTEQGHQAENKVIKYLGLKTDSIMGLAPWNNASERTQEEVINALRLTALTLLQGNEDKVES